MEYEVTAKAIITAVGGKANIASVSHCVTRLRLVLVKQSDADDDMVKAIPGVKSVVKANGQYQVIIGQEVVDLAPVVADQLGLPVGEVAADDDDILKVPEAKEGDSAFNRFIRVISACIFPLCGLLIASGMLKGILTICTQFGLMDAAGGTYLVLNATSQATMYFLPILVGFIAGKTFGCNPYLTAVIGAAMIYPDVVTAYSEGNSLTFLGIPLVLTKYASQLFPVLLASWFAAKVEKFWKRIVPRVVSLMCVPLLTLIVVVPVAFLVIGPLMTAVSNVLAIMVEAIINVSPMIAGAIMGAFWQLLIMLGVARAFAPLMMNNITNLGADPIAAMTGAATFGLIGAGLGYMVKQKSSSARADAFTNTLTCIFGVTEPMIYTLALPKKTPFIASWIGGGVGGAIIGLTGTCTFTYGGGGIFQGLLVVSADNPMNFVWWAVAAVAATAVSFVVALVICKNESPEEANESSKSEATGSTVLPAA